MVDEVLYILDVNPLKGPVTLVQFCSSRETRFWLAPPIAVICIATRGQCFMIMSNYYCCCCCCHCYSPYNPPVLYMQLFLNVLLKKILIFLHSCLIQCIISLQQTPELLYFPSCVSFTSKTQRGTCKCVYMVLKYFLAFL